MASILFVCLGNICRSPAAEALLRHLATQENVELHIESCGVGDWHVGSLPDTRMQKAAQDRGVALTSRAKIFEPAHFYNFDYILAADKDVLHELYSRAKKPEHKAKIHLITDYSTAYRGQDVPDPYYQGEAGFELVLDMLEDSCAALLHHLKKK